jgi:hypothetical protein
MADSTASAKVTDPLAQWKEEQRKERMRLMKQNSRFSMPFAIRLPSATGLAFMVGMGLGIAHGSEVAGLRFRAENAHRLPTTPTGWYLYHKSKNYQAAHGGVMEGLKMGAKVSFWTAAFFSIEEMFDRYRGTKDFLNTVIASCSVAGAFSVWSKSHPALDPDVLDNTILFSTTTLVRRAQWNVQDIVKSYKLFL